MPKKPLRKRQEPPSPLTTSPAKRQAARKPTASFQGNLPPGLSQPSLRALAAAKLTTLDQLAKVREADIAKLHGMGPKGVTTIRDALKARGQSFKK
jgi:hypothetical protein